MKMKNKRAQVGSMIIIALLMVGAFVIAVSNLGLTATVSETISGSGDWFDSFIFYYDKCEAIGSQKWTSWNSVSEKGQWLAKPDVSGDYDINLQIDGSNWKNPPKVEYYICITDSAEDPSKCRVYSAVKQFEWENEVFTISDIKNNEYVWVQFQRKVLYTYGIDEGNYQVGYVPYGIRRYNSLSGSSNVLSESNCDYVDNSYNYRVLSTDITKYDYDDDIEEGSLSKSLQPEEVRWFVGGTIIRSTDKNLVDYEGEDAWCQMNGQTANIYKVNTIETASGTKKVASAEMSDFLGKEECCPGEVRGSQICNDDFELQDLNNAECEKDIDCGSINWYAYDNKKISRPYCDDGACSLEIKDVECSSNADCDYKDMVCDTNDFECVKADVNLEDTTPEDETCESRGGVWISKTETKTRWIFPDKVTTEEYCSLDKESDYGWILGVILWIFIFGLIWVIIKFRLQIAEFIKSIIRVIIPI